MSDENVFDGDTFDGDEENVRIANWTPPWLDNGARLREIVDGLIDLDDPLSWQIMCLLLARTLENDIAIAAEVNRFVYEGEEED